MKSKILKISVILLLIMTMTMVNFIYIGKTFISYAIDDISTNVKNIEFGAYFKDENGQKVTQMKPTQMETNMVLQITVKNDGYFNGQVELGNTNFKIKEIVGSNEFVNKIEGNTITLSQINAGSTVEIEVKVELLKAEIFDSKLFDMESQITLKGIYKDSSERDISVVSSKNVKLSYPSANLVEENIVTDMEVITNKNININGEDKKVIQVALRLGLKDNSVPTKEIVLENTAIGTNDKSNIEIISSAHMNMTTKWESHTKGNTISMKLTNDLQNEKIIWKDEGNEEIILTYVAKKDADIKNQEISANVKMILFDGQEVTKELKTNLDVSKELNNTITTKIENVETQMYKGKLYQGIDREFSTNTDIFIDLANAHEYLEIKEDNLFGQTENANVVYQSSILNKEQWMKVLGEEGKITIINKDGDTITTLDKNTQTDENGNVIVDYGQGQEGIVLKTTTPISTGKLELTHNKILKDNRNLNLKKATNFSTIAYVTDNLVLDKKLEKDNKNVALMELKEPKTEARLEVNKDSLSTVITNNVEMKVVLKTNNEAYDLYQNPIITIALPEDIEKIDLTKIEMLYEEELKIKSYRVEGRNIIVELEGKQTAYKGDTIEGANIVIYANITLNQKAASKDAQIQMNYTNKQASQTIENVVTPIKVVAPTEITAIYQIPELGIETIGQEENKIATLPVGAEVKQVGSYIEVINNKPDAIHNVSILGVFSTKNSENTINTSIIEGIKVQGIENAKIYYTENEKATEDINNKENGWVENISDSTKIKKYLIVIDEMGSQSRLIATYKTQIPEKLEYNQKAKQWYEVSYTDSKTKTQNKVSSAQIEMTTGVGPRVEVALNGKVGTQNLQNGDKVKAGEVIKYTVEVSNTGSEEVKDAKITAPIPEGTIYVEAKPNYEYTGPSYYQEVNKTTFETTIQSIKPGEKLTREYEVRVNKDIQTGKEIKNMVQVTTGELTKDTNELKYIAEAGDIRISVKRITDRDVPIYTGGVIQYFAMIENTSSQAKENVQVQTKLPEGVEVGRVLLMTGMEESDVKDDELHPVDETVKDGKDIIVTEEMLLKNSAKGKNMTSEEIEYSDNINIGTLEAGETKVISYDIALKREDNKKNVITFSTIAKQGNREYRSNEWIDELNHFEIGLEITSSVPDTYVRAEDELQYTIKVKNNSKVITQGLTITDEIPEQLTITQIIKDGQEISLPKSNNLQLDVTVDALQESIIQIKTVVDYDETQEEPVTITNKAEAKVYGQTVATTAELVHIIEVTDENGNGSGDGNTDNNVDDNNIAQGNRIISGMAWYDENANGIKEDNENVLSGITVKLLNIETNQFVKDTSGNVLQAITNDKGIYTLNNIGNGKYVAIFEYDITQYALTRYQAEGANDNNNSKAMMNELIIDGNKQQVASTDIIEIKDSNIANINAGFIKLQNFDLKLDKYVSKIIVQNKAGTTVKEYNDETLAKIELDGKLINGTTVIIEYQIKVTNAGEVPGYVRSIADYAPSDLTFSSELNKDWHKSGNVLYNTSLANTKLEAGESKTVTLTLTKSMTENNTGRVNNTAEIAESYNELGIADSNSVTGNKTQGENDMGVADVIIGIKTGGMVILGSVIGITLIVLGIVVIFFQNKRMKISQNTRKIDKIS